MRKKSENSVGVAETAPVDLLAGLQVGLLLGHPRLQRLVLRHVVAVQEADLILELLASEMVIENLRRVHTGMSTS